MMVPALRAALARVTEGADRYKDFASDLLVLKLASSQTLQKLASLLATGETDFTAGDIGSLGCTLFMMRLHLHSVNGREVPSKHRAIPSADTE